MRIEMENFNLRTATNTKLVEIALTWKSENWPCLPSELAKELARRMCADEEYNCKLEID